jgi:hypothetical protein
MARKALAARAKGSIAGRVARRTSPPSTPAGFTPSRGCGSDGMSRREQEGHQTKLTDTQLCILSKAAQREDGIVILPERLRGGAAQAVLGKLIDGGLVEEIAGGPDLPAWRQDEEGRPVALRITSAGLEAIGIETENEGEGSEGAEKAGPEGSEPVQGGLEQKAGAAPLIGSKQALVIEMLAREGGASMDELTAATGWLPHTTRAALSGLRKKGHAITRAKRADGASVYRIEAGSTVAEEGGGEERPPGGSAPI